MCHDTVYVWEFQGNPVTVAAATMKEHDCWGTDLDGADVLVIDQ